MSTQVAVFAEGRVTALTLWCGWKAELSHWTCDVSWRMSDLSGPVACLEGWVTSLSLLCGWKDDRFPSWKLVRKNICRELTKAQEIQMWETDLHQFAILFYFFYLRGKKYLKFLFLYICMCVYKHMGDQGGRRRMWDPLEPELQAVVSCQIWN